MTPPGLCCACDATLDVCVRWRGAVPLLKLSSRSREALVPTGCSINDVNAASPSIHSRRCIVRAEPCRVGEFCRHKRKKIAEAAPRRRRMVLRWCPSARSPRRA